MVSFLLVLQETDRFEGDYTGRELSKQCEHSVLPDLNHRIVIGLYDHEVSDIEHNLEAGTIRVLVPVVVDDFVDIWASAESQGWEKENFS